MSLIKWSHRVLSDTREKVQRQREAGLEVPI